MCVSRVALTTLSVGLLTLAAQTGALSASGANLETPAFPGGSWALRSPEEAGLDRNKLNALRYLVGGRGCVVRKGYLVYTWDDPCKSADVASAVKPGHGGIDRARPLKAGFTLVRLRQVPSRLGGGTHGHAELPSAG